MTLPIHSFTFRYGSHGFEMINVTYSGDRLIAYKVTGDKNIPRGEITFTADLSPFSTELPGQSKLEPILLSESSAKKWGTTRLPRFRGQGYVSLVNSDALQHSTLIS